MTKYGFTSRRYETETGLWYFRARYYNSELGRFISRDPAGFVDGPSLYAGYFAGLQTIDPSGKEIPTGGLGRLGGSCGCGDGDNGTPWQDTVDKYAGHVADFYDVLGYINPVIGMSAGTARGLQQGARQDKMHRDVGMSTWNRSANIFAGTFTPSLGAAAYGTDVYVDESGKPIVRNLGGVERTFTIGMAGLELFLIGKAISPKGKVCTTKNHSGDVEPSVFRVTTPGKPEFQLRQGEEGLSVFDAQKVSPKDILPHFREGSALRSKTVQEIQDLGLTVKRTPGDPKLPKKLQDAHMDVGPGENMSRKQFKKTIKKLEPNG